MAELEDAIVGAATGTPPFPPDALLPHDFTLSGDGKKLLPDDPGRYKPEDFSADGDWSRMTLSNGHFFNYPNKQMSLEEAEKHRQGIENMLHQTYAEQAQKQGSPYETRDYVYSPTMHYPRNAFGRMGANLDFNPVVDWIERRTNEFNRVKVPLTDISMQDIGETGLRVAPMGLPGVAPAELATRGYNAVKHGISPESGTSGDLPVPGVEFRKGIGAPELPQDAGWVREVAEAVLTGKPVAAGASVAGSHVGGDVAAAVGGERWREAGSLAGGAAGAAAPGAARTTVTRGLAKEMKTPESEGLFGAGRDLAVDKYAREQGGLPGPILPGFAGVPWGETRRQRILENLPNLASTRSMVNPEWQSIFNWLRSQPWVGRRLQQDVDAHFAATKEAVGASVNDLLGGRGGLPPTGTKESVGDIATTAARAAVPVFARMQSEPYENFYRQVPLDTETNITPVLQRAADVIAGNQLPPPQERALVNTAQSNLESATPYGSNFRPEQRPAVFMGQNPRSFVGPLAPTVPLGLLKRFLSSTTAQMGPEALTAGGENLRVLKSGTLDAIRNLAQTRGGQALANQFDFARTNYKTQQRVLDMLYGVGGKPTHFEEGMPQWGTRPPEADAAAIVYRHRSSPSGYEPFANALTAAGLDPMRSAIGAHVGASLGQSKTAGGGFRPEELSKDLSEWSPGMQTQLFGGPPQVPGALSPLQRLETAGKLGEHFDTPPARSGLVHRIGIGSFLRGLSEMSEQALGKRFGAAAAGGAIRGFAGKVTSPEMKQALGGIPPGYWDAIAKRAPTAAVVADQQAEKNYRFPPGAPRPDRTPLIVPLPMTRRGTRTPPP
jgi:hypothetical protein